MTFEQFQWGCSVAVALYPSPGPQTHFAHCSAHIPSPTQMRRFFYLIAAMQVFVLAMYTVLWYHYGSALVCERSSGALSELARHGEERAEGIIGRQFTQTPVPYSVSYRTAYHIVRDYGAGPSWVSVPYRMAQNGLHYGITLAKNSLVGAVGRL